MKISYNWLNRHIDLKNMEAETLGDILTSLGLEVEGMERFSSVQGNLEGVVIGKVLESEKHPDADRLSVTTVDVGEEENLQIVCGAPNVAAGQTVAVAKVGATLYPDGEEFNIKKAKIRGVSSSGMICSETELSIGTSGEGIMVLPDNYEAGKPLSDYIEVYSDVVYEIGLTPNRSDATHHRGVARDLLAYFKIHSGEDYELKEVAVELPGVSEHKDIQLNIIATEACPRYAGIVIDDITVGESPEWMQNLLKSIGQKPLNNVVDMTNFILHDVGQPLHAFDYDKIAGNEIRVQHLPKGTIFTTLDDKKVELLQEDLIICDKEDNAMCMAGVYGGLDSGVSDETKTIFLESAHFDAETIRKTSMKHFLRTDAAKVFEKGSNPSIVRDVLERAATMLTELAGGKIASEIVEHYPEEIQPHIIDLRFQRVNELIGKEIDSAEIKRILEALGIKISSESRTSVKVQIPTDKNDVTREVDVIEEILRIYGFDQVDAVSTSNSAAFPVTLPDEQSLRRDISRMLQGRGFYEMMNVSLTDSGYYEDKEELVFINNTSNKNLDIMRPDMNVSALETAAYNINRNQRDFAFYEWGKSYGKVDGKYEEHFSLSLLLSGTTRNAHWSGGNAVQADFYDLKAHVEGVLQRLGISGYQSEELSGDKYYSYGLKYFRGPMNLVSFGKVKNSVSDKFDIETDIFTAVFNWDVIRKNIPSGNLVYKNVNKFPSIHRDLALVAEKSISYSEIEKVISKALKNHLVSMSLFDIYTDDERLGADKHSLAVHLELQDENQTMQEKQIESLMKKVLSDLKGKLGIELR